MAEKRAVVSVSDKTGVVDFARGLVDRGFRVISTGGTARKLGDAGVPVTEVSEVTGHPEMMEGRVKTLHPAIQAGILARRHRDDDLEALAEAGYEAIDVVAVNLYPFRERVRGGGVGVADAMEQVDIGGPTLLRAAAKNHADVWAVVDPSDYGTVLGALDGETEAGRGLRRALAAKVFGHVSGYDAAIAGWLEARAAGDGAPADEADGALPELLTPVLGRVQPLRYGENPDQAAAFYAPAGEILRGIPSLQKLHGKALSYNNLLDVDGALLALAPYAFSPEPACAIVKHTTPCGLAVGATPVEAYRRALRTDAMSAFGGIVALSRTVDAGAADAIADHFLEVVVAPGFEPEALERLTEKKSLRLLAIPGGEGEELAERLSPGWAAWLDEAGLEGEPRRVAAFLALHGRVPDARVARSVYGGTLVQEPPVPPFYPVGAGEEWEVATEREPTDDEWRDLRFAWAAVFSVKSNAILLARDGATVGIGAGQMSRVDASKIAVRKAADAEIDTAGSVLASDAFFPFRDGVDAAAEAGVRAIVQPGGSIRDDEVIEAADEHGIAMVLTGRRLFRH